MYCLIEGYGLSRVLTFCCPAGKFMYKPPSMQYNPAFASKDFIDALHGSGHEEVDVCLHDIWAVGSLYLFMLTAQYTFSPKVPERDGEIDWEGFWNKHQEWVMPSACV